MLWRYTRRDTKVLLLATLLTVSGYAYLLADSWKHELVQSMQTAQVVGVFASVAPNEANTRMAALDAREAELQARESLLFEEITRRDRTMLVIVTAIGAVLLVLILLNFYLDQKRRMSLA